MAFRWTHALLALAAAAPFLGATDDAEACGGCFIPPSSPSVVTGHRMALSMSPTQTVLWDQIQYAGDPEDFAWVLPVKPGAVIQTSTDAFFETLEGFSVVQVQQANVDCGNSGGGIGCGGDIAAEAAGAADGSGGRTVDVVHHGTVGPYETVTLRTDTEGALNEWLDDHGYNVDDETQPIIDAYVAEGFDFIALRLQPGQGVRSMTPVRIVTEGADPTLPLRMVAAGAGPEVNLVLYVISEGRWKVENFPEAEIPRELVSWDFATEESNYAELRNLALEEQNGRGWLTAYAQQGVLHQQFDNTGFGGPGFLTTYFNQAFSNAEIMRDCSINQNGVQQDPINPEDVVVNPCTLGPDGETEVCGEVGVGQTDARELACEGADDVAMALTGLHPADVWVTRLEANLPREALDVDLRLTVAEEQERVSSTVVAQVAVNAQQFCGSAAPVIRTPGDAGPSDRGTMMVLTVCAMGLLAGFARRRRSSQLRA